MSEIKIINGQIWKQHKFPCFQIMVVMLNSEDGEMLFARLGCGHSGVPILMTEENGDWQYTAANLSILLTDLDYALVGSGRIEVVADQEVSGE